MIEDESLVDIPLEGTAPLAIAALAPKAPVLSIGSLSKLFWGGLRIGWIRAPEPVIVAPRQPEGRVRPRARRC